MASYICSQTREIIVEAESAAEAREKSEAVFYARPGHDQTLRRAMRYNPVKIEKRRD